MEGVFTVNAESGVVSDGARYNPDFLSVWVVQNMRAILTLLCVVLINTPALASEFGKHNKEAIPVSMHCLLANPEKLNSKVVRITGIVNLEFESNVIFVDSENVDYYNPQNGYRFDINEKALGITDEIALALRGKMVVVEGIFYGHDPHMDRCVEKNKKSGTNLCVTIGTDYAGRIEKVNYLSVRVKMS